jgi:hypothetical protein
VTSDGERIALLEEAVRRHEHELNGGGNVEWKRSVRGRLHNVETEQDAARLAKAALDEVRRNQQRTWTARERHVALLIAAIGVVTPYVLLGLRLHGHG